MIKRYIIFASMGFELVALILGCFYISQYLEAKYPSKGLIFVCLVFASLIGWLVRVIWLLKKIQKEEEQEELNETKR